MNLNDDVTIYEVEPEDITRQLTERAEVIEQIIEDQESSQGVSQTFLRETKFDVILNTQHGIEVNGELVSFSE